MQAKLIRLDDGHRCYRPFSQSSLLFDKPRAIPNGQINLCGGRAVAWVESEVAEWIRLLESTASRNGGEV